MSLVFDLNIKSSEISSAYPRCSIFLSLFSNLNLVPGQTTPNLAVVPVGPDGSITVFSQRGTHVVVDVFGYFTNQTADPSSDGLFVPLSPSRLLDTRRDGKPGAGGDVAIARGEQSRPPRLALAVSKKN